MRLIDADALKKVLESHIDIRETYRDISPNDIKIRIDEINNCLRLIDNAPTVDTTCPNCDSGYAQGYSDGYLKGKEERTHGKWIEHYDTEDGFTWLTCSRCMFKAYEEDYNFCPNCGADMRKEAENGN